MVGSTSTSLVLVRPGDPFEAKKGCARSEKLSAQFILKAGQYRLLSALCIAGYRDQEASLVVLEIGRRFVESGPTMDTRTIGRERCDDDVHVADVAGQNRFFTLDRYGDEMSVDNVGGS